MSIGRRVALLACVVDVLDRGDLVALAGVEVVYSVGGGGVDGSSALVSRDVGGGHAEDGAVEEGVLEGCAFELAAREETDNIGLCGWLGSILAAHQVAVDDDGGEERLGDNVGAGRGVEGDVLHGWVEATAMEAGMVQGVVVQMMVYTSLPSPAWMALGSLVSL